MTTTKAFINPLWLVAVVIIMLGAIGTAYWYARQSVPLASKVKPIELPIAGDQKSVESQPQQTQLSLDLVNITPQIVDEGHPLPPEMSSKIEKDLGDILKEQRYYHPYAEGALIFAVGKRYVLFAAVEGRDCGGPTFLLDAVTQKMKTLPGLPLFLTDKRAVLVVSPGFYTYTPDSPDIEIIEGSQVSGSEVFVDSGICDRPVYSRGPTSLTVDVATLRGTDSTTGDLMLGPIRKITFALPR